MMLSCMCTSGMFRSGPRKMTLLKYFKHIKPSKEERIQNILPKPDGLLAHLIPCLTIETANYVIVPYVTVSAKTVLNGTCIITRKTDLKYSRCCGSVVLDFSHARFTV